MKKILNNHIYIYIFIIIFILTGCKKKEKPHTYDFVKDNKYVAHAFGGIDEITYTNSLEAFKLNYSLGHRVFEVDFDFLEDHLICNHDKSIWEEAVPNKEYTYDNFKNELLYGKYHTLDIDDLVDLMKEYEDIYIITDTKYTNEEIVKKQFKEIKKAFKKYKEGLKRIIPQIYNYEMYDYIDDIYHFDSVIITLYLMPDFNIDDVITFCKEKTIFYITMWASLYNEEIKEKTKNNNIFVNVHSINNADYASNLFNQGVDMIYTDFLYD